MNIERIEVGIYRCNCYILSIDNKCLIIDPGDEVDKIINVINNREVKGILITHNHFDHIGALKKLVDKYKVKAYDYNSLKEQVYSIDKFKFKIIYNPGHTNDSISFLFNKNLFCGDFIFYHEIGRCDLPTGDYAVMKESINKIKKYDKDIIIYPGHGENTTLLEEIDNNYYFS